MTKALGKCIQFLGRLPTYLHRKPRRLLQSLGARILSGTPTVFSHIPPSYGQGILTVGKLWTKLLIVGDFGGAGTIRCTSRVCDIHVYCPSLPVPRTVFKTVTKSAIGATRYRYGLVAILQAGCRSTGEADEQSRSLLRCSSL